MSLHLKQHVLLKRFDRRPSQVFQGVILWTASDTKISPNDSFAKVHHSESHQCVACIFHIILEY